MKIDRVKLIAIMAERNMTCTKLSKQTGIALSTISSIRSGKSCLYETATKIAKALGVDVSEIIRED